MRTVAAVIRRGEKYYIGECLGIDVITQGKTIDETLSNLKEAVALYFESEPPEKLRLPQEPPMPVTPPFIRNSTREHLVALLIE